MSELADGMICHIEIPAPDLDKAFSFYSNVFGWKTSRAEGMNYAFFTVGELGGGFDPEMPVVEGGLNLVLKADDIPAKLREIEAAGGTLVKEKTEIPDGHGYYALFKDPNGNRLGIWSNR